MLEDPKHWNDYYKGSDEEKRWARRYSYSDRIRYYWNTPGIKKSIETLLLNLEGLKIPLPMLSQFMRSQYRKIRNGSLKNNPKALIKDRIIEEFEDYIQAVNH